MKSALTKFVYKSMRACLIQCALGFTLQSLKLFALGVEDHQPESIRAICAWHGTMTTWIARDPELQRTAGD